MSSDLGVGAQCRCKDEANLALLQDVGGAIAQPCLGARVSDQRHAKRGTVEVRCLPCIADVELDVIRPLERKEVSGGLLSLKRCLCSHGEISVTTSCTDENMPPMELLASACLHLYSPGNA